MQVSSLVQLFTCAVFFGKLNISKHAQDQRLRGVTRVEGMPCETACSLNKMNVTSTKYQGKRLIGERNRVLNIIESMSRELSVSDSSIKQIKSL